MSGQRRWWRRREWDQGKDSETEMVFDCEEERIPDLIGSATDKKSGITLRFEDMQDDGTNLKQYMQKPVLDIDMRCWTVPSETDGHYHLFIDKELDWYQYEELLEVLARVGIIQEGYYEAARRRGATFVAATPWKDKR